MIKVYNVKEYELITWTRDHEIKPQRNKYLCTKLYTDVLKGEIKTI